MSKIHVRLSDVTNGQTVELRAVSAAMGVEG